MMMIEVLTSKLHGVTEAEANLNYMGRITTYEEKIKRKNIHIIIHQPKLL